MKKYDIVIIGSGSGGLTAAYTAKGFGKSVILIDEHLPGGECTWSGCIPSKALIHEAEKVHQAKQYTDFEYDTKEALDHVKSIIQKVYATESIEQLEKDGIDFLKGKASFKSSKEILVHGQSILGKKVVIATGSKPFVPPIPGLKDVDYLDNTSLFKLERLPKSMIILGGGAIGVEMAQALNRLGVEVHLIEMMDKILFREEGELSDRLASILEKEGVHLHLNSKVTAVKEDQGILATYEHNGQSHTLSAERILVVVGRQANVDLNLEAAGIEYERNIPVNDYMQTNQKNIFAVGDVSSKYMFSHMANVQGIQAVQNAVLPFNRKAKQDHVAWTTFTSPELARAGMTEKEAKEKYKDVRVYEYEFNHLDRAITKGETQEMIKIILDKKGRVLGASILADRAGEIISEIQLLKTYKMNFSKLAGVIHPYPTYGEVLNKLGKQVLIDNIMLNPVVKLFRK